MRVAVESNSYSNAFEYVMANYAAGIAPAATAFSQAGFLNSKLSFREFEAGRTRIAQINGCLTCQGFRPAQMLGDYLEHGGNSESGSSVVTRGPAPDEEFYESVADWQASPLFSKRERLVIEYADKFANDPQGLAYDDDFWTRFRDDFSDEETVDLSLCMAGWLGLGRVTHALGLDGACAVGASSPSGRT